MKDAPGPERFTFLDPGSMTDAAHDQKAPGGLPVHQASGTSSTPGDVEAPANPGAAYEDLGEKPSDDEAGGWSQTITTAILLLAMLGILVEVGIWAWGRLSAYGLGDTFPEVEVVSLEDGSPGTWVPATGGEAPPTLLVLFTTTCPVCQGNVPSWNALHDDVSPEVRVVGLSMDPRARTRRFVASFGVRFPVEIVVDAEALMEEIALASVPLTLVLDPDGRLVEYWEGPVGRELRSTIRGRLAELAPALSSSTSVEPTASRRRHGSPRTGQPTRSRVLLGLSTRGTTAEPQPGRPVGSMISSR